MPTRPAHSPQTTCPAPTINMGAVPDTATMGGCTPIRKRRKAERKAEKTHKNKKKACCRARKHERTYALYISCVTPRGRSPWRSLLIREVIRTEVIERVISHTVSKYCAPNKSCGSTISTGCCGELQRSPPALNAVAAAQTCTDRIKL
jgi:hypothetical protein